ncbi:sphingomyelin phosphodiesterase [Aquicella siphonis]|nr:sphingomyelin phosphodiesterase [Aquicella siphonis]
MFKLIMFFMLGFCLPSFSVAGVIPKTAGRDAAAAPVFGYSYVLVTNNTSENLSFQTALDTDDADFTSGKNWEGSSVTLLPYETRQILWFSRNTGVKTDKSYQFSVKVSRSNGSGEQIDIQFHEKGKRVFGSDVKAGLVLPGQPAKSILADKGLEQFPVNIWGGEYRIHARNWLPAGRIFNNFHLVIDKPDHQGGDSSSNQSINILTYNTQLMPFYAGAVDDLNHPEIRAADIPARISQYDAVIMEELFDRDLRSAMVQSMTKNYPYHTKVVGQEGSKVLTGGVMIFSKWPIKDEGQIVYQAGAGMNALAAKGAIYARIDKNNKTYHLVGTHMQAGNRPDDISVRQKQLQELALFIDSLPIPDDEPLLIGGDFNVNQFDKELENLLGILNVSLLENTGYPYSADGVVNTMSINKDRSRIDYLFYSNLHAKPGKAFNRVFILRDLENEKMWPKFDLSDHFPLSACFDFRRDDA